MNRQSWNFRFTGLFAALAALTAVAAMPALAQVPVDEQGNPLGSAAESGASGYSDTGQVPVLNGGELAELVGPVALYPDDLLAIVLPASTYPLEIVQAARFLEQYEQDSTLQPNEEWDESVTALLNYPEVLKMMNDDIDWTWKLGDAVVNQQADVIAAVESFRDRAYAAGNLKSDQYQTVAEDDGIIEIVPVQDDIIYVPYYEPEHVVVRQVRPVYYYYPRPYPVYYYPYPAGFSFYSGYFWGVTTAYRIGWLSDHLHVHHHSYWGHPYFGHSYYGHYYRRPSVQVYNTWYVNNSTYYSSNRYRDGDYWRPRTTSRARPAYYTSRTRSYRNDDVRRGDTARSYGNAYTTQVSANRTDRARTAGTSVRPAQTSSREFVRDPARDPAREPARDSVRNSSREVRGDTIRFRERNDSRQTVREQPARATTRASNETRQTVREQPAQITTRASTDTRRTGTSAPANRRNADRESPRDRDSVVRAPTSARSDNAVVRRVESGNSNPLRADARTESRQNARVESRGESRGESRSESRTESRPAQASVRQGNDRANDRANERRRDRN